MCVDECMQGILFANVRVIDVYSILAHVRTILLCYCEWVCTLFGFSSQVARAGRFGTKGLAITFVSEESDATTLNSVQDRFEVNVSELPDELDVTTYSK